MLRILSLVQRLVGKDAVQSVNTTSAPQHRFYLIAGHNRLGKLCIGYTISSELIDSGNFRMKFRLPFSMGEADQLSDGTDRYLESLSVPFGVSEMTFGNGDLAIVYWVNSTEVERVKSDDWKENGHPFFVPIDMIEDPTTWPGLSKEPYYMDRELLSQLIGELEKHLSNAPA